MSASLIPSWPNNASTSYLAVWDDIILAIMLRFAAFWVMMRACVWESEWVNYNDWGKQWGLVLTGKSQCYWTIVQFNPRLSGFIKASKALLVNTIKQERGGWSTYFGWPYIFFPWETPMFLIHYDTTVRLMNTEITQKAWLESSNYGKRRKSKRYSVLFLSPTTMPCLS